MLAEPHCSSYSLSVVPSVQREGSYCFVGIYWYLETGLMPSLNRE